MYISSCTSVKLIKIFVQFNYSNCLLRVLAAPSFALNLLRPALSSSSYSFLCSNFRRPRSRRFFWAWSLIGAVMSRRQTFSEHHKPGWRQSKHHRWKWLWVANYREKNLLVATYRIRTKKWKYFEVNTFGSWRKELCAAAVESRRESESRSASTIGWWMEASDCEEIG